jgi:hypothetical protein
MHLSTQLELLQSSALTTPGAIIMRARANAAKTRHDFFVIMGLPFINIFIARAY